MTVVLCGLQRQGAQESGENQESLRQSHFDPSFVSSSLTETVDVDDGLGERLRRLLRKVVTDATRDVSVLVLAREFPSVGAGLGMGGAVGVALHGDRGHPDDRGLA